MTRAVHRFDCISPAVIDESSELGRLARVLYFGYGVTGFAQTHTGTHLFRAAPSAGALYPAEVYVVTQGIAGLADGLHNYAVRHHQLVPVIDGEFGAELERICLGHPAVRQARATIIVTANYFRSAWRYRERCYRRALLDTGHVLGNVCLYSPLERLLAIPIRPGTRAGGRGCSSCAIRTGISSRSAGPSDGPPGRQPFTLFFYPEQDTQRRFPYPD